jgi:tetratricopeptide (TPR) repeat protein
MRRSQSWPESSPTKILIKINNKEMKQAIPYFFTAVLFTFLLVPTNAQPYIPLDSARKLVASPGSQVEKFRGLRSVERYYYTTGLFDSAEIAEKEMFAIAKELKADSMMAIVYRAIGNRYVIKTDYNFSIINYAKGLDYTSPAEQRRGGLYLNLAYVYIVTGNTEVALDYLQKAAVIGVGGESLFFENLLRGMVNVNLDKPDSALFYFRQAENVPVKINDALLNSVFLLQTGRAYELKGDNDLAETYYKKTMAFCKEKNLPYSIMRTGNIYCSFLMQHGRYDEAKKIAIENLETCRKAGIKEGISNVAEVLRKLYTHEGQKDSIIYYAQLQIDYKDSASSQKKQAEFQNLTFGQQLRQIDELIKVKETENQRKQNIQYVLIALGIITLLILYLLLSRSFITNTKLIEFFGVIALLIIFEFLNLLLHPFLESVTHHSPVLMLLALVFIAALLVPLHHKVEKWATAKLVEKNKKIRLAAAKKTIAQLEEKEG